MDSPVNILASEGKFLLRSFFLLYNGLDKVLIHSEYISTEVCK